ncbi:MAG TPA: ABC transporter permease subunit [Clostridia bacterium]|nr:ABC transporter permease subunit [Clostridia bacterium]
MVLPGAIWLLLLRYLPMFGIVMAFQNFEFYYDNPTLFNNIIHSSWVGLQNFAFLFATSECWQMLLNTIGYNLVFIILGTIISVAFAIMMSELTQKTLMKAYQTMMFFPFFLSWVVASYFLYAFLAPDDGLLVHLFKNLEITQLGWYNDTRPWPYLIVFAHMWKNVGYTVVLYMAAIVGIDASQYEAARIDGASKWKQIRYVTLPHLTTLIVVLLIINVGKIFNSDFGLFFTVPMDSGSLIPVTQVVDTYVYRALLSTGDIGMSTAAGLFQSAVGFALVLITNAIVRKVDPDSAMF